MIGLLGVGEGSVLDVLEKAIPLTKFYPGWAKALFIATFVLLLLSVFIYVVLFPSSSSGTPESQQQGRP